MRCSGYNFDGSYCDRRHAPDGEHKRVVSIAWSCHGWMMLVTARCGHVFAMSNRPSDVLSMSGVLIKHLDAHERWCETWTKVLSAAMVANVQVGRDQ